MNLTGRCLCGAVSYRFEGDPLFVFFCHCHDCQQSSGSLLHLGILVPEAGFRCEGELREYTKRSDEGREIARAFCPTCGSGILNRLLGLAPGTVVIKGGSLDDPSAVKPSFEVFTNTKAACIATDANLLSFAREATVPSDQLLWKG